MMILISMVKFALGEVFMVTAIFSSKEEKNKWTKYSLENKK
jgi:hypothetical protein